MLKLKIRLKWKILLGVTLTSTIAVVISTALNTVLELRRLDDSINTQTLTTAKLIGANTTAALAFSDSISAGKTLESLRSNRLILGAVVFDENSTSFASYSINDQTERTLPSRPGEFSIKRNPDSGYVEIFDPIMADGQRIGSLYLRVSLEEYEQVLGSVMFWSMVIILVITGFSLTIALFVQRSIVKPINEVVEALRDIAEGDGDLTKRIAVTSEDEVGQLAHWFNVFVERIHEVVTKFKDSALDLTSSAEQLSSTTNQTANGAIKQQSEIDQVATAMNEMASTVEEVARNVGLAASDAERADQESNNGKEVVGQTMRAIEELASDIDKASDVISQLQQETESIGSVLDVIRGIAEQTNLLALNAAIEAARAGEQGRGFAVVADEVRTLASRTQASTEEIQEMIEKLQTGAKEAVMVMTKGKEQASSSVEHAARAGESLAAITEAVSVIKDMSNQIASASEEQSAVTVEIKQNINNISQVANETASGSKEISSGSVELVRLAADLKELVSHFRV